MSRKLDKWIGAEVFGDEYIETGMFEIHKIGPQGIEYLPFYSSHSDSALEVLKKLQEMYPSLIFHLWWDSAWFLERENIVKDIFQLAHDMTDPAMAICRGAYRQITGERWDEDN